MYHIWGTNQDAIGSSSGFGKLHCDKVDTRTSYEAALEEIDRLMDAESDTPEGDRLAVLTTLIEAWEQKHYQI